MPRILLVSDIHANLVALDAVIEDARRNGDFDSVWSLGDAVGYGPRPNECLDRLADLEAVTVAGNHELASTEQISVGDFNRFARAAAEWTSSVLTDSARRMVEQMPLNHVAGDFTLVHGSPSDPVWEYVTDHVIAYRNLGDFDTAVCLHGHTHVPAALGFDENNNPVEQGHGAGETANIRAGHWFVNPGSVGQPRDGDPRAGYAFLDTESMQAQFFRVPYDIEQTQSQMAEAGLPDMLIQRLSFGL